MKIEEMLNKIHLETQGNFEYLKQIPDNSIDLIIIDPPYLTPKEFPQMGFQIGIIHWEKDYKGSVLIKDLP